MIYNVQPTSTDRKVSDYFIPVADGVYYTKDIGNIDTIMTEQTGDFALCFYDENKDPVTPTAGTVVPMMSPFDGVWLAPGVGDTSINATSVVVDADGTATYSVPVFLGGAVKGRITLADIEGATYVRAQFRRFR